MKEKVLFEETQRFTQWWIRGIIIGILLIFLISIYVQIVNDNPVGTKPLSDMGLVVMTFFMVLFMILFYSFHLKTKITKDKIYFKFFPFHSTDKAYLISDIQNMEVVKYSPILEYGGWGIRGFGNNKAFNVKGNKGLRILFKDGSKRLIGTQKPEELKNVISKLDLTAKS